jgi:hypothetical protein
MDNLEMTSGERALRQDLTSAFSKRAVRMKSVDDDAGFLAHLERLADFGNDDCRTPCEKRYEARTRAATA